MQKATWNTFVMLFILIMITGLTACDGEIEVAPGGLLGNSGDVAGTQQEVAPTPGTNAATGPDTEFVWIVEPTLEHESISLCSCGAFVNPHWEIIDPTTGLLSEDPHLGHGGTSPGWVYDPSQNLFGHPGFGHAYHTLVGMHPINEFDETVRDIFGFDGSNEWIDFISQSSKGLIIVQSVDSSQRVDSEWSEADGDWELTALAQSGKYALMYNREPVTDFIFDGGVQMQRGFAIANDFPYASMNMGRLWGLVDKNGITVLPFVFENLLIINESTAFAKYNGSYGILDLVQLQ